MKVGMISGWLIARCKICGTKYNWFIDEAWPFVNSEFVGTCSDCINEIDHDIIDETYDPIKVIGRKVFPKKA